MLNKTWYVLCAFKFDNRGNAVKMFGDGGRLLRSVEKLQISQKLKPVICFQINFSYIT